MSALSAAEEDELEIVDIVRERSGCIFVAPPLPKNREEGAGRVATEWREEMEVLREGMWAWEDVDCGEWVTPAFAE